MQKVKRKHCFCCLKLLQQLQILQQQNHTHLQTTPQQMQLQQTQNVLSHLLLELQQKQRQINGNTLANSQHLSSQLLAQQQQQQLALSPTQQSSVNTLPIQEQFIKSIAALLVQHQQQRNGEQHRQQVLLTLIKVTL